MRYAFPNTATECLICADLHNNGSRFVYITWVNKWLLGLKHGGLRRQTIGSEVDHGSALGRDWEDSFGVGRVFGNRLLREGTEILVISENGSEAGGFEFRPCKVMSAAMSAVG